MLIAFRKPPVAVCRTDVAHSGALAIFGRCLLLVQKIGDRNVERLGNVGERVKRRGGLPLLDLAKHIAGNALARQCGLRHPAFLSQFANFFT